MYLADYRHLKASRERALSYDLMSALSHLSLSAGPLRVIEAARGFSSPVTLGDGLPFLSFVTERLDRRR